MPGASPPSLFRPYRLSFAAIVLCGAVAALWVYREARRNEDDQVEAEFTRRATVQRALTQDVLDRYAESLFGLAALFTLDGHVSRREFARATARVEKRLSGALAFEWVPTVPESDRPNFERELRAVYPREGFRFVDFDAQNHPIPAAPRPVHYPITYLEPLRGNEAALGYDLAGGPTQLFLTRARETRRMMITRQFRLVQGTATQLGVVMIWPVFRPPQPPGAAASHAEVRSGANDEFIGFLQCVFHVDQLLETACTSQPDPVLDVLFVDASETDPAKQILYYHPGVAGGRSAESSPTEADFANTGPFSCDLPLTIGERDWRALYRPRDEWLAAQRSTAPMFRGAGILLLSLLLGGLVNVLGRRTQTIRREVDERTAELAESRRRYASLIHALPGVAFRGTVRNEEFVLEFVSEGTLALSGWSAGELMAGAIPLRDLIHPDDRDRVRAETLAALSAQQDVELEYRICCRGGRVKWVLERGRAVYDANGKPQVFEGLAIDITPGKQAEVDRLTMERQLLETQKLESLGLLAGGIAHDFNNLLSTVLGNASLARMSLESSSVADPQLCAIETAALRAAELCRQMLAYAGKGRFLVEAVDLSALVRDLLPLLEVSIARSAELHLALARTTPPVNADATQLRQIVMNLVLNAVDALAGRNGAIVVATGVTTADAALLARCVVGTALPPGDYVFLDVKDTGCGMSPEILGKIFDPFFTTKSTGRGLGLAAVLGIVRSHHGALLVESQPDHGTIFRMLLPIAPDDATPAAPPATSETRWRRAGDVLLIDDDEPVRTVMAEMLKTFGLSPESFADGQQGVQAFRENASRWTLAVIDLLMPGMTGEQALGAIHAIKPDVPVLLISGYAEGDIRSRLTVSNRVAFLAKPFRRESLEQKLRELLP